MLFHDFPGAFFDPLFQIRILGVDIVELFLVLALQFGGAGLVLDRLGVLLVRGACARRLCRRSRRNEGGDCISGSSGSER